MTSGSVQTDSTKMTFSFAEKDLKEKEKRIKNKESSRLRQEKIPTLHRSKIAFLRILVVLVASNTATSPPPSSHSKRQSKTSAAMLSLAEVAFWFPAEKKSAVCAVPFITSRR
jgi:ADP-ribosylglycohydrolase